MGKQNWTQSYNVYNSLILTQYSAALLVADMLPNDEIITRNEENEKGLC